MECDWNWLRERQLTYTGMFIGTNKNISGLGFDVGSTGPGGVGVLQCMLCKFLHQSKASPPIAETEEPMVRDNRLLQLKNAISPTNLTELGISKEESAFAL
jgi:hypothetical protein